ncbi:hypothetical protein CKO09_10820 [Chromatium weissei]|nr:hypothetical protein [Chromatium weissei]
MRWILRNIESLRESSVPVHIIIVDNASTDSTVKSIASTFPDVEIIQLKKNVGFGVGNNIGISKAVDLKKEFTFLFNQDAFVSKTAIEMMVNFLEHNQNFDVVSPLHCSPDFFTLDQKTFRNYIQRYAFQYLSDISVGHGAADFYQIKGVNAAAWFMRTSVFQKVGGFDPLFHMYGEDDDLIQRFHLHQVKFALLPKARIVHCRESATPSESPSWWQQIKRKSTRNRSSLITQIKHPSFSISHMIFQLISTGIIKPCANVIVDRDLYEFFGTWLATIKVTTEILKINRHAKLTSKTGAHFL